MLEKLMFVDLRPVSSFTKLSQAFTFSGLLLCWKFLVSFAWFALDCQFRRRGCWIRGQAVFAVDLDSRKAANCSFYEITDMWTHVVFNEALRMEITPQCLPERWTRKPATVGQIR